MQQRYGQYRVGKGIIPPDSAYLWTKSAKTGFCKMDSLGKKIKSLIAIGKIKM